MFPFDFLFNSTQRRPNPAQKNCETRSHIIQQGWGTCQKNLQTRTPNLQQGRGASQKHMRTATPTSKEDTQTATPHGWRTERETLTHCDYSTAGPQAKKTHKQRRTTRLAGA